MIDEINKVDECLRLACVASTLSLKIYNLIRAVGHRELSADNALHQMVEVCHDLTGMSGDISALADILGKERSEIVK